MSANYSLDMNKISSNRRRMSGLSAQSKANSKSASTNQRLLSSSNKIDDSKLEDGHVRVAVRCRPLSEKEINDNHQSIVEFESNTRIVVHDTSATPGDNLGTKSDDRRNISHVYDFDAVFDWNSRQRDIYDTVCKPIVDSVLSGYNGTIFAYGQTGTGKTYTMEGVNMARKRRKSSVTKVTTTGMDNRNSSATKSRKNSNTHLNEPDNNIKDAAGIIPRAFEHIFNHVSLNRDVQFLIRASYLEIYQEEIHDLLRKDTTTKLEIHERPDSGVYVKDLTSFVCKSISEIERVMKVGNQNRIVAATDMNEHSSRSHAIFMITVEQLANTTTSSSELKDGNLISKKEEGHEERRRVIKVGKLNLVDLAGSERQRKTNSSGQRQRESIKINLSLSALGNVINSLMKLNNIQQSNNSDYKLDSSATQHTPYRDSKLTRLLQDSLGGNARTLMVANIGPANYNYDETINTLNYASRAKCIRNKPRINEDPKDALLRELQREIDDLKSKIATISNKNNKFNNMKEKTTSNGNFIGGKDDDTSNKSAQLEFLELKQKLSSLQNKLLNGKERQEGDLLSTTLLSENLLQGYTEEQELELEKSKAALADQEGRQRAIRDELEKREEAELLAKESFSSIQQEVDAKKDLIKQILLKIKAMRDQIDTTQNSYRLELDELDQLQYVLQKELKLKCLIMDNYIPNNHVNHLLPRIVYNSEKNFCSIKPIDLPLDFCIINDDLESMEDNIRYSDIFEFSEDCIMAKSEFEKISETIYPNNIRYKYENIIEPKLEYPIEIDFTNRQFNVLNEVEESVGFNIQDLIDKALNQHEPDIVI